MLNQAANATYNIIGNGTRTIFADASGNASASTSGQQCSKAGHKARTASDGIHGHVHKHVRAEPVSVATSHMFVKTSLVTNRNITAIHHMMGERSR